MYPFERYLRKLKKNVRNKARVEGSICNAYLVEEASTFCSYYFEEHVSTKLRNVPRNYDAGASIGEDYHPNILSVFKKHGHPLGKMSHRYLDDKECKAAHLYILLNCIEITEIYLKLFVDQLHVVNPSISEVDVGVKIEEKFAFWFETYMTVRGRGVGRFAGRSGGRTGASSSSYAPFSTNGSGIGGSLGNLSLGGTGSTTTSMTANGGDATSATATSKSLIQLTIVDSVLWPCNQVSAQIYKSFKKIRNPKGYSWKVTPESVKTAYWEEFTKIFSWDPALDSVVHQAWCVKASQRYRSFVYNIKVGRRDPKKGKPDYITEPEWQGWQEYWDSTDVQAKSQIAKKCRMSGPDGPNTGPVKHKGGSKSAIQYATELAAQRGVTTKECIYDAFEILHKTKEGGFTDEKSARIAKEIYDMADELSQPLPGLTEPRAVDMNQIYLEVMGGGVDKKKRMFGVGSLAQSIRNSTGPPRTNTATTFQIDTHLIDHRLEEMEQKLQEERELRQHLEDQVKAQAEQFQKQQKLIEQLISQSTRASTHSSPPPS